MRKELLSAKYHQNSQVQPTKGRRYLECSSSPISRHSFTRDDSRGVYKFSMSLQSPDQLFRWL
jgi:hypothetical protein